MRITCPEEFCQATATATATATITSRNTISAKIAEVYCSCTNPECLTSFVATISYKNTLQPSMKRQRSLFSEMLNCLPKNEQKAILLHFQKMSELP